MKHIKSIVNAGRSSGVFLLTSLQKPTSDSIPTDIKAQLTTRIALNILDKTTCSVVMGDNLAVGLFERELVCRTIGIGIMKIQSRDIQIINYIEQYGGTINQISKLFFNGSYDAAKRRLKILQDNKFINGAVHPIINKKVYYKKKIPS